MAQANTSITKRVGFGRWTVQARSLVLGFGGYNYTASTMTISTAPYRRCGNSFEKIQKVNPCYPPKKKTMQQSTITFSLALQYSALSPSVLHFLPVATSEQTKTQPANHCFKRYTTYSQ